MKKTFVLIVAAVVLAVVSLQFLDSPQPNNAETEHRVTPRQQADDLELAEEGAQVARTENSIPGAGGVEAVIATTAQAALLEMADEELDAYIRVLPTWSESKSEFEAKYEGFSTEMLVRAGDLLSTVLGEEQRSLLQSRVQTGEYEERQVDENGDDAGWPEWPTGDEIQSGLFAGIISEDGTEKFVRFRFGSQNYPLIYYRAREMGWVTNELRRRR